MNFALQVRSRGRLQFPDHWAAGPKPGRITEYLLWQVHAENRADDRGPAALHHRIHSLQELCAPRHKASGVLAGLGQAAEKHLYQRLWRFEEVPRPTHAPAHSLQGQEANDGDDALRVTERAQRPRAQQKRWPGVPLLHADFFPEGVAALAGVARRLQGRQVHQGQGKEDIDDHRAAVPGAAGWIRHLSEVRA